MQTAEELLDEMGLSETPSILVFNKIDLAGEELLNYMRGLHPNAIFVSGWREEGIDQLCQAITKNYEGRLTPLTLNLSYDKFNLLDDIREFALILETTYTETGITLQLKIAKNFENKIMDLINKDWPEW